MVNRPRFDREWLTSETGIRTIAMGLTTLTVGLSIPKHVDFGYWAESPLAWGIYLLIAIVVTYWLSLTVLREFIQEVAL